MVRYQLAFSLGMLPGSRSAPTLSALAIRDGADPWMRIAILSSVTGCTREVFDRLIADASFRNSKTGRVFLSDLVSQTGASERREDLAAIFRALDGTLEADPSLSRDIVLALMSTDSAAARAQLRMKGKAAAESVRFRRHPVRCACDRQRRREARFGAGRCGEVAQIRIAGGHRRTARGPAGTEAASFRAGRGHRDPRSLR